MKNILVLLLLLVSFFANAKKPYFIEIPKNGIKMNNRTFYIDRVVDNRSKKSYIGMVSTGIFGNSRPATTSNGLMVDVFNFYKNALPKANNQIPITIFIDHFEIIEKINFATETGIADISFSYYSNDRKLFEDKQHVEITSSDVTRLHGQNISLALAKTIFAFNKSDWLTILKDTTQSPSQQAVASDTTSNIVTTSYKDTDEGSYDTYENTNRNNFIIGYQIGGYTLIGFDYEIRIHDYFGFHTGAGLYGYNIGLNIHLKPTKNSSFFNLSYKDGGFGRLSAIGVEFGSKIKFSRKSDLGLFFQFGLVKIVQMDNMLQNLFNISNSNQIYSLSLGFGLGW